MYKSKACLLFCLFFGLVTVKTNAASFTVSGNLTNHNDVVRIAFSVLNDASNLRIWTDSFLATGSDQLGPGTNFDPTLTLWNADTGGFLDENEDNAIIAPGQTRFDSGFSLPSLTAGNYLLTVVAFPNEAAGANISNGFSLDSVAPILISEWEQPDNVGNLRGSFWRVNLDGVDSIIPPPTSVPLPAAVWLFGSAITGLLFSSRKKASIR